MVEYAILLVVMVLLIAGGLELAIAAYNGHATTQAARAGANEWMQRLATLAYYDSNGQPTFADGRGLGDHDPASNPFTRPRCNTLTAAEPYDDGLPDDGNVYLYNPLPIDITDCIGEDDVDGVSRITVLVSGRADGSYRGLPGLNQSIRSMYVKACRDEGASPARFISCGREYNPANPDHRILLKLPGWLDPADDTVKLWNYDGAGNLKSEPVFALQCARYGSSDDEPCDTADTAHPDANRRPGDICWRDSGPDVVPLACNVRVQYRYRHVFESLVLMGLEGAPEEVPPADQELFDSGVAAGGILGSEQRQVGSTANPGSLGMKLKARKDFCSAYASASAITPPGGDPQNGRGGLIHAASWVEDLVNGNYVIVTTAQPHQLSDGDMVRISGFEPRGYNGVFRIGLPSADPFGFTYRLSNDPGAVIEPGFFLTGFTNTETFRTGCR